MRKRNWVEYNRQLVRRGSLTFFIHPSIIKKLNPKKRSKKAGRPQQFSDHLIEMLLLIKIHYRLSYRALEGFVKSTIIHHLPGVKLPSYSLICKRMKDLKYSLPKLSNRRPNCILLDASGLKITGEGEWKVKIHGQDKRRKWLKVHVALDANTQEIVGHVTTESNVHDGMVIEDLLNQIDGKPEEVIADGAYDGKRTRDAIRKKGAKSLVPPRVDAVYKGRGDDRDESILEIIGLGNDSMARSLWKKLKRYGRRSLVETCFSRLKTLYGDRLFSTTKDRQCVESHLKCYLLNKLLKP